MRELPITGYLNRWSGRPGSALKVHVSVRDATPYRVRLVRVISADANPEGPGVVFEDHAVRFDRIFPGSRKPIHLGSYGLVPRGPSRPADAACTWTCLVWSDLLEDPAKAVLAEGDIVLKAGARGAEAAVGSLTLATGMRLRPRSWYRLWLSLDPVTGAVILGQRPVDRFLSHEARVIDGNLDARIDVGGPVLFAAADADEPSLHFNGRIEAPAILSGTLREWDAPLDLPQGEVLAAWDFAQGIDGLDLIDTGPQACHGHLVNLPTRAVKGAAWTGREMCWRHAPQDYAAIEFHDDDLNDCAWAADFDFVIPDGLKSGSYALHLTCEGGEDWLPLFVLPPKGTATAPIAVLMPTFTYVAYACHARGNLDDAHRARLADWKAYPHNPDDYPIYGRSTYNVHPDGSGVAYSTWLRPMITTRPGYVVFNDPKGSGTRHYVSDHHLLAWLEAKGFDFDVVTDDDLHAEGVDLLKPYRALLTASHPEYHTLQTLDALMAYTRGGGKMAYLGGNGFYWRIALSDKVPGTIELRRTETGVRMWAAEPAEYHHAFDGQYGGLWQRQGRPPQVLCGVGFSAQGAYEATYYRRQPGAADPRVAWIMEGVEEEIIGDYGLCAGGAAGFELDRAVPRLGSPDNLVILARSENVPRSFFAVPEEIFGLSSISGERPSQMIRGEIVHFDLPGGGAVFSVGSITFCGSLWKDGAWQGPVSRMLENVVRRFQA